MTQQDNLRLLEALLFAATRPLELRQIAERFPEDQVEKIPELLEELQSAYKERGIHLVERDKKWAFRTAEDLGGALKLEREVPKKLSRAAIETLAIIAYHQPVTRAEIESIRGVATSKGTLDILIEAGWVKPGRRRQVPGRPLTWVNTTAFFDHFGLEDREALPGIEELKATGLLDKRPAIETIPNTADMFDEDDEEDGEDDFENFDELMAEEG